MNTKDINVEVGDTVLIEAVVIGKERSDYAGDLTIEVQLSGDDDTWIYASIIKEVIPKPFDWADVDAGMCFLYNGEKVYFCYSKNDKHRSFSMEKYAAPQILGINNLTRHKDGDLK